MHGCEAGANRGKGGERESVHVELFFQSRVQVCLKNLGFLGGARAPLLFIPLSLSLFRLNELKKKRENVDDIVDVRSSFVESFDKKRIRSKIDWDLDKERKIKISIQEIPFFSLSSFSFIMRRQKLIIPELNSNGWGIG